MLTLMRYHLGTVAKGAFIITLVEIPRLILTYIHTQLKGKVRLVPAVKKQKLDLIPYFLYLTFSVDKNEVLIYIVLCRKTHVLAVC